MRSEFVLIFVLLVFVIVLGFYQAKKSKGGPTSGHVRFNSVRHERHFDKASGSIVLEQAGPI